MSADSRRSSSSSAATVQSGSLASQASTNNVMRSSAIVRRNSNANKKSNPVRRCQSMKNPNVSNGNSCAIQSSPSFRINGRRPSVVNGLCGSERNSSESEFVKYYQYKNRPDPVIPFRIYIDDGSMNGKNIPLKGTKCRVLVLGSHSSGKTSLIKHFERYVAEQNGEVDSDEDIYNGKNGQDEFVPGKNGKSNGNSLLKPELTVKFKEARSLDIFYPVSPINIFHPDAYIVVYAVNSRESFESAKRIISEIYKWDDFESKTVILVANKTDLVRSRIVSKQEGRQLAITNNCKYIETSCAISHNVDFLLAGIGTQITLKNNSKQSTLTNNAINSSQKKSSLRKPNIIQRFLNKTVLNKSKSCDNLHVL